MKDTSMLHLVADHMEDGFLENIIDMFKHDRGLYRLVPGLMADERSRVRIGTVCLLETLRNMHEDEMARLIKETAPLLMHENAMVRGDVAYMLGVIGSKEAVSYLKQSLDEKVMEVRQIILETIEELESV